MVKSKSFKSFVSELNSKYRGIAETLHKVLLEIQPDYDTRTAWNGYGYKLGRNYSCLMVEYKDHLKLMIWRGVDLKDPKNKLEGEGTNTRHIKYYSVDDIDKQYLQQLLDQQFSLFESGVQWEG